MTIEELLDIETIKNLRIFGAQYLDSGRFDDLAALYTDDALCEFGPYGTWRGKPQEGCVHGRGAAPAHRDRRTNRERPGRARRVGWRSVPAVMLRP